MVYISRDPRWGRVSEGSGEDPYLGSLIAKAMINGYQGDDLKKNNTIMACVKHFALYGAVEAGPCFAAGPWAGSLMQREFDDGCEEAGEFHVKSLDGYDSINFYLVSDAQSWRARASAHETQHN